jgi:sRNA-binding carbon storage regulator CsrA
VRDFLLGKDEAVIVNGDIKVVVIDIGGDEVTLAIELPDWVGIWEADSIRDLEFAGKD